MVPFKLPSAVPSIIFQRKGVQETEGYMHASCVALSRGLLNVSGYKSPDRGVSPHVDRVPELVRSPHHLRGHSSPSRPVKRPLRYRLQGRESKPEAVCRLVPILQPASG